MALGPAYGALPSKASNAPSANIALTLGLPAEVFAAER
jgi:hypothetical protein